MKAPVNPNFLKRYYLAQNNEVREILKKALTLKGIKL